MRKVEATLNEDFVDSLDAVVKELNTTRSAFNREALREAVKHYNIRRLETKHRRGYALQPVKKGVSLTCGKMNRIGGRNQARRDSMSQIQVPG